MLQHRLVFSSLLSLALVASCDDSATGSPQGKADASTAKKGGDAAATVTSSGATSTSGTTSTAGTIATGTTSMSGTATTGGGTGTTTSTGSGTSTGSSSGTRTGSSSGTNTGSSSGTSTGSSNGTGSLRLPQDGNPVHVRFNLYKEYAAKADSILSYQLANGGWDKNQEYGGTGSGGSGSGTFDNGATTMELTAMADAYKRTSNKKYLDSARKAMDFVLKAQYPSGGWPQFYPLRGGYHDHATFNDDAMSRVLTLLQHAVDRTDPFDTDVFTESQRSQFQKAVDGGVDYILKAQITQNGKKTAWCAQHGATDYLPKKARDYEHPSISGSESIEVIGFLMTQPQTPAIKSAVAAALEWFRSPNTYLADHTYDSSKEGSNPFVPKVGSKVWYRFYDIPTNLPIFSNYDGKIWLGLENQSKRKSGYRWGGEWGPRIFTYAEKVGY